MTIEERQQWAKERKEWAAEFIQNHLEDQSDTPEFMQVNVRQREGWPCIGCCDSPRRGCKASRCHYGDHTASRRVCSGSCDYFGCWTAKTAQAVVNLAEAASEKVCIAALSAFNAVVGACCKGVVDLQKGGVWIAQQAVSVAQKAASAAKTAVSKITSYLVAALKNLMNFKLEYVGFVTNGFGGAFAFLARVNFSGDVRNYNFEFQITKAGLVALGKSIFTRVFSKGANEAQAKAKKDMPKLELLSTAEHLVAVPDSVDAAQKALDEAAIDVKNVMEFDEWQKELVMLDDEQRSQEERTPKQRHVRINVEGTNFVCAVS